jgi:hypothetical protein
MYAGDVSVSKKSDTVTIGTSRLIIPGATLLPSSVAPSSLSNGLVAYYPFNGNANDESVNRNNGTVYGATLTVDRFGNKDNAYNFNGLDSYIEVSDHITLRPTIISISAWIKTNLNVGCVIGKTNYSDAKNEQYALNIDFRSQLGTHFGIKQKSECVSGVGWIYCGKDKKVDDNLWHNITVTFDGSSMKLYVEGILEKTTTLFNNRIDECIGGKLQIGRWWSSDSMYFKGLIDDIRIYNRALTQEEITYIANN